MKRKIAVLSNEFTQTLLESPFFKKETFQFDFDDYVCALTELILPAPLNLPSQVHLQDPLVLLHVAF